MSACSEEIDIREESTPVARFRFKNKKNAEAVFIRSSGNVEKNSINVHFLAAR